MDTTLDSPERVFESLQSKKDLRSISFPSVLNALQHAPEAQIIIALCEEIRIRAGVVGFQKIADTMDATDPDSWVHALDTNTVPELHCYFTNVGYPPLTHAFLDYALQATPFGIALSFQIMEEMQAKEKAWIRNLGKPSKFTNRRRVR